MENFTRSRLLATGEDFHDALVDGATSESAVEEVESDQGEQDIGAPGSEGGGHVAGFTKGEKESGCKKHAGTKEERDGDTSTDAASAENNT